MVKVILAWDSTVDFYTGDQMKNMIGLPEVEVSEETLERWQRNEAAYAADEAERMALYRAARESQ